MFFSKGTPGFRGAIQIARLWGGMPDPTGLERKDCDQTQIYNISFVFQSYMLLDNATGKRRHTPFLDFLANTNKTVNRLFGAFLSLPILKIHVSSDFVDIIPRLPTTTALRGRTTANGSGWYGNLRMSGSRQSRPSRRCRRERPGTWKALRWDWSVRAGKSE